MLIGYNLIKLQRLQHTVVGNLHGILECFKRAVYDAILALKPGEADAYYLRGNARLSQGRFEEAKEDFDAALKLNPASCNRAQAGYKSLHCPRSYSDIRCIHW